MAHHVHRNANMGSSVLIRESWYEPLVALSPETVDERVRLGHALLIDIREADEFARRHV